jgi:A/G-specific adenine glycosylase
MRQESVARRDSEIPNGHSSLARRANVHSIQLYLLGWFADHRRNLPWRGNRDPYRIWVSEIMLQQTQVATVISYFNRFIQSFPTVDDLARADEQAVLRAWEGLGYYRRARNLHRAARIIVDEHQGQFPDDPLALRRLPGLGRYTANAVLSQAFDQALPIVEANSRRVLSRLLGLKSDPSKGRGARLLWQAAEALVPKKRAGDFNQSLMELGALVCTVKNPDCSRCPIRKFCVARASGLQEAIPIRLIKPKTIVCREVAVVLRKGERLLLVQRQARGRWAGMWEFPHAALVKKESPAAAAERFLKESVGIRAKIGGTLLTLTHQVTHHRIVMDCLAADYLAGRFRSTFYNAARWIRLEEIGDYPLSSPQRRLARLMISETLPV